ncbi:MAG: hypothetical protein JWO09_2760 [Bacteroidetes bacterium]|nr:hypothetical protein [Bacteroidota bacterium]
MIDLLRVGCQFERSRERVLVFQIGDIRLYCVNGTQIFTDFFMLKIKIACDAYDYL